MRLLWALAGAVLGVIVGTVLGFVVAFGAIVLVEPTERDPSGFYSLLDALGWTPVGSVAGLLLGILWGLRGPGRSRTTRS